MERITKKPHSSPPKTVKTSTFKPKNFEILGGSTDKIGGETLTS
jgi:hypothetical protein